MASLANIQIRLLTDDEQPRLLLIDDTFFYFGYALEGEHSGWYVLVRIDDEDTDSVLATCNPNSYSFDEAYELARAVAPIYSEDMG